MEALDISWDGVVWVVVEGFLGSDVIEDDVDRL